MAAFGFTPEDYGPVVDTIEVWPDNMQAVSAFSALSTQWRPGFAGPVGLDYTAVITYLRELGLRRDDRTEVFCLIQVMEREALEQMHPDRSS